jgi:4-hydroxy-tetrahydrodipicolinate reductase
VLRVGVVGAAGRMGQEVCRWIAAAEDLELVAAVDPKLGTSVVPVPGGAPGVPASDTVDALERAGVEVAVDFTMAEALRVNLPWYADHGVHAVVGTTGLSEQELEDARSRFASSGANAVVAPNFAIGAVLLIRLCELAAPFMDAAEVIELHHAAKRDAPSGTAVHTARCIAQARRVAGKGDFPADATVQWVLEGARGAEGPGGVRVHSVRLPGLVAHEEVLFGQEGQSLTIRHDSYDRQSFKAGVLLAVRAVPGRPGLTVGLAPLLGF